MSIAVALEGLREEARRFGPVAYLLSVSQEGRPRVVGVRPEWDGDRLVVPAGARTRANATQRPAVTLLWPSPAPGELSLIVDGTASVSGAGGHERLVVSPASAVLHQPAGPPEPQ